IGDVTGDGRGEVLVGAFGEGPLQGRAYLFSGSTYSLIRAIDHPEPQDGARFSEAVAMGDMNNDHLADLALSAPAQEANGVFEAGRVYLFDGPTGVLHNSLQSPDPTPGGEFGAAIATSDMNNDGSAELAIGAP